MSIAEITEKITPILKQYGIKKASIFGSFSRGDERPDSDVDLLVEFDKTQHLSLFGKMHIKHTLEDVLGKNVDLVSEGAIDQFIEPYIRAELKTIYEG